MKKLGLLTMAAPVLEFKQGETKMDLMTWIITRSEWKKESVLADPGQGASNILSFIPG